MRMLEQYLDLHFSNCTLAISARRIWEHTLLRQVNPFTPITPITALRPQIYVDVIDVSNGPKELTGYTLADVLAGKHSKLPRPTVAELLLRANKKAARLWLDDLRQHLLTYCDQRAVRNAPHPFLPTNTGSPLGVQGLRSALMDWLNDHQDDKARADQWFARIANLKNKGLRLDELESTRLEQNLHQRTGLTLTGREVRACVDFGFLHLSVIPMIRTTESRLFFTNVTQRTPFKRIKPKLKCGLASTPQWRDRLFGYWVDTVTWDDLLGPTQKWMAFTHRGQPIVSIEKPSGLCDTHTEALALANQHAAKSFPKLTAVGKWSQYRLTGGEQYREWLVTLPYYPQSYDSSHFPHRNVLLHVRCDIREDANGMRVLVLHEVQSDWAQQVRRDLKESDIVSDIMPVPPWFQEWPALALKLMLLHAIQQGAAALAWTRGDVQVRRYKGLGKAGLLELYDRTLPAEAARILRPYSKKCEEVEVFLPVNFYIDPAEIGYEVLDDDGSLLGTAATWDEAQKLLPNGAHEILKPMHGIHLDASLREALLRDGFYAWGTGIH